MKTCCSCAGAMGRYAHIPIYVYKCIHVPTYSYSILNIPFSLYIVDLRSDPTLVGCNIFRVARVFFVVWRLVRSKQDGERAEPLANMLLGAKHAGRPPIMSRIIVKEYCAL